MIWSFIAQSPAPADSASSGSATGSLLMLGGLFVLFYFLAIRPQQKRVRAQQALVASIEVGDRIETVSGILGTITDLTDAEAKVEIAPGVVVTMAKGAVRRKVSS